LNAFEQGFAAFAIYVFDEFQEYFGIGFAFEFVAFLLEQFFQDGVIFDNTVVDDGQSSRGRIMGMGVDGVGFSVGGPARVGDTQGGRRHVGEQGFQVLDLAFGFPHFHFIIIDQCHTGTVVAAIFQAFESVDEHGQGLVGANVSYDSTHGSKIFSKI